MDRAALSADLRDECEDLLYDIIISLGSIEVGSDYKAGMEAVRRLREILGL